jgi:hypothetical protein
VASSVIKDNTAPAATRLAPGFNVDVVDAKVPPAGIAAVAPFATQTFVPGWYENTAT